MTTKWQFIWGVIGAFAGELLRFHKLVDVRGGIPEDIYLYLLTAIGMLFVGGWWSAALESDKKFLAFYHGLTAPIVLAVLIK